MTRRDHHPTVLEHFAIGGLKPELLAQLKARQQAADMERALGDTHRKRQACHCALVRTLRPAIDRGH